MPATHLNISQRCKPRDLQSNGRLLRTTIENQLTLFFSGLKIHVPVSRSGFELLNHHGSPMSFWWNFSGLRSLEIAPESCRLPRVLMSLAVRCQGGSPFRWVCVSLYMALFAGYAVYHIPLNGHMNRGNYDWAVDVLGDPKPIFVHLSLYNIHTVYRVVCYLLCFND